LFFNSIFVAAGTIVGTLLIALPAAYALSHLDIRGKNPIMLFVLASQLFSPILIIFPLYRIMAGLNLLNTLWGVIIGDILYSLAFSVLLLTGFFRTVPKEVVECAHLDGASRMLVLRKILVPLAAPGIVVTVMYVFINTWNDFIFAFMFNNQMDAYTVIVGIYDLLSRTIRGVVRWDYIMVAAFYSSLPILILFIGMSKRLVGGLTVGAVKG
jgi:ABC-type glycerol-3-phosphate transport system permease component